MYTLCALWGTLGFIEILARKQESNILFTHWCLHIVFPHFRAFIDLKQAFDTVWRNGLWQKLMRFNINGKYLTLIKNMYQNIKSCVRVNSECSPIFSCNVGVRQGENLSPLLFSLFLNDINVFFVQNNYENGISIPNYENDTIRDFLKIFILLYADDTVILSDSEVGLQNALNIYAEYCNNWKLIVNISKSKIIIFSRATVKLYFFLLKMKVWK